MLGILCIHPLVLHAVLSDVPTNPFQVDDWSAKVEYLEDWEVIPEESVDGPALHINYGVSI